MITILNSSHLFSTITVGGFNGLAAVFGLIAIAQVSQFIYYGLDQNDPSKG